MYTLDAEPALLFMLKTMQGLGMCNPMAGLPVLPTLLGDE